MNAQEIRELQIKEIKESVDVLGGHVAIDKLNIWLSDGADSITDEAEGESIKVEAIGYEEGVLGLDMATGDFWDMNDLSDFEVDLLHDCIFFPEKYLDNEKETE